MDLTTEDGMTQYLISNLYPSCHKVERLPEGFGGFVFRVHQTDENLPQTIIVKHVQPYAARSPSWKLDQSRLVSNPVRSLLRTDAILMKLQQYEYKALQLLSTPELQHQTVRPPKVFHFDKDAWVLIIEDAGDVPSLKGYLKPGIDLNDAASKGAALGHFLANFHNKTAADEELKQQFNGNETAKHLSGTLYFGKLPQFAESLGCTGEHIRKAAVEGERDVREGNEVLTLGDFWTGNVLVGKDGTLFVLDVELAKPGTSDFDIGQMAAEMYCIAAFRDQELGMAVLNAFLKAYSESRDGKVDTAKVAIRIGAHLFAIMPNAWKSEASEERIQEEVKIGDELIRMGVKNDKHELKNSILKPLLS